MADQGDRDQQEHNVTSVGYCKLWIFPWRGQKGEGERSKPGSREHLEHLLHRLSTSDTRRVHPWFRESFSGWLSSPSAGEGPPPPHSVLWEANLEASFAICGLPHAGKSLSWGDVQTFQSSAKKWERGREYGPKNPPKSLANFSVHPPDSTSSTRST